MKKINNLLRNVRKISILHCIHNALMRFPPSDLRQTVRMLHQDFHVQLTSVTGKLFDKWLLKLHQYPPLLK